MAWRPTGIVVAAILFTGAALASPATIAKSTTTSGHGISLRLPPRWTGVIYQRVGGFPIMHAASFRLRPIDGDDGAQRAVQRMHAGDVLMVMLEYHPSFNRFPDRALPLRLQRSDFGAPVEGMPLSRAFARIRFLTAGRAFDLWIEFGRKRASATRHAHRRPSACDLARPRSLETGRAPSHKTDAVASAKTQLSRTSTRGGRGRTWPSRA